jgi:hypothetical protein
MNENNKIPKQNISKFFEKISQRIKKDKSRRQRMQVHERKL